MTDLFSAYENPKSKALALITFDPKTLRTAVNEKDETVYCLSDVLAMITETTSPRSLMRDVQKRLLKQGVQLCEIVAHYKFMATNGRRYSMLGGTREQIFRNAYGKKQIDGVYDVVGSIISSTARQLSEVFA